MQQAPSPERKKYFGHIQAAALLEAEVQQKKLAMEEQRLALERDELKLKQMKVRLEIEEIELKKANQRRQMIFWGNHSLHFPSQRQEFKNFLRPLTT